MAQDCAYDTPASPPHESLHYQELSHGEGDTVINSLDELLVLLETDITAKSVAVWSCVLGYAEALTTHPKNRYSIYPLPFTALERLTTIFSPPTAANHRDAARQMANYVWDSVKSTQKKDELHANTLYCMLQPACGKAIDCFGAALLTVLGLRQQGYESILALSEDHAYEMHIGEHNQACTCEVAIPGSTQLQRQKRALEVGETLKKSTLTPQSSWLYMQDAAYQCTIPKEMLTAAVANLCTLIQTKGGVETNSAPLLELKRELLWKMYPLDDSMALINLALCEEHVPSERKSAVENVSLIESLYMQAVAATQPLDKHVYPYTTYAIYCKCHQDDVSKLTQACDLFGRAARVVSYYPYEPGDSRLLVKEMVDAASCMYNDVLHDDEGEVRKVPNALVEYMWRFYDWLFLWGERTGQEILSSIRQIFVQTAKIVDHKQRCRTLDSPFQSARLQGPVQQALRHAKLQNLTMSLCLVVERGTKRRRTQK